MAALMASRELLHQLASAANPNVLARVACLQADVRAVTDTFRLSRRFASYLRPDGTFNPDFDKPSAGYSYPSTSSSIPSMDAASFMEEASEEYALPVVDTCAPAESTLAADAVELKLTRAQVRKRGLAKAEACLEKGQLEGAMSWIQQTPAVIQTEDARPFQRLIGDLQQALLASNGRDMNILMAFAFTAAAKGLYHDGRRRALMAHIARHSPPERLKRFWRLYATQVRTTARAMPLRGRRSAETHLQTSAGVIIRQLCLAGRFQECVDLLTHTRDAFGRLVGKDASEAQSAMGIRWQTYAFLLDEMKRQDADAELVERVSIALGQDWPGKKKEKEMRLQSSRAADSGRSSSVRFTDAEGIEAMRRRILEGLPVSTAQISAHINRRWRADAGRSVIQFGDWMVRQRPQYRSLWHTCRIYRMLQPRLTRQRSARRALLICAEEFDTTTLPSVIVDYLRQNHPSQMRPTSRQRIWMSSHTATLVLQAWLLIDPSYANIVTTYDSFVEAAYGNKGSCFVLPTQSLPDQLSYQPFLVALAKVKRPGTGLQILTDMVNRGIMPSAHNWDVILGSLAALGRLQLVDEVMRRRTASPATNEASEQTSHANVFARDETRTGFVEPARVNAISDPSSATPDKASTPWMHWLDSFRLPPVDAVTFNSILRNLSSAGALEAASSYKKQLYEARHPNGNLVYRWRASHRVDTTLGIIDSKLASQRRRMGRLQSANPG